MMNTYYEILGVAPGASQTEIKKAYFKMVRKYSPESDPEQFQKIREAYEQLKDAGNIAEGPVFPPFSELAAERMAKQIEVYRREGDSKRYRDACEEAWHLFPEDIQFLYLLAAAQRRCGNTGKAVKSAELLVSKEPDNKWFQRELAVSYIERGFTQKAYWACERAYELGCRDMDFVLMYSIECNEYGEYDTGVQILLEIIRQEKRWSKEEMPELLETYIGLFQMNKYGTGTYFSEIVERLSSTLEQYSIYMADYITELIALMAIACMSAGNEEGEYQKAEQLLDVMEKICRTDSEKSLLAAAREQIFYQRILDDPRIGETLKCGCQACYAMDDLDDYIRKFALTDVQLCMIEEREEILEQAEIIRQDYPDYYEKLRYFFEKLESGHNLAYLKESLQKTYRRMEPDMGGGMYYEKYPQEKRRALGTRINEGEEEEPYVRSSKKIGRNDPCPCGSGKKYKHCCMNK